MAEYKDDDFLTLYPGCIQTEKRSFLKPILMSAKRSKNGDDRCAGDD